MIKNIINTSILDFSEKFIDNNPVTFYKIKVFDNLNKKNWEIERRFNDFYNLFTDLNTLFKDYNMKNFPSKSIKKINNKEVLENRKNLLDKFLEFNVSKIEILFSKPMIDFLEIKNNIFEIFEYLTNIFISYDYKQKFEINDMQYIKEKNFLFFIGNDNNLITKVNKVNKSFIDTLKFWKKDIKNDKEIKLGSSNFLYLNFNKNSINKNSNTEIYENTDNNINNISNNNIVIKLLWQKLYNERPTCLFYEENNNNFYVAFFSGKIFCYSFTEQNTIKFILKIDNNISKITGLYMDNLLNNVFTVDVQKYFFAHDITFNQNYTKIKVSSYPYNNLRFSHDLYFLTNDGGEIEIYDSKFFPPKFIKSYKSLCEGKNNITDIFINDKINLCICSSQGNIACFDFNNNNKDKKDEKVDEEIIQTKEKNINNKKDDDIIKEKFYFNVKYNLTSITYDNKNNVFILGDNEGRIILCDYIKGNIISLWKGHEKCINKLILIQENRILISCGNDSKINFWKLPNYYINKYIDDFYQKISLNNIIINNPQV